MTFQQGEGPQRDYGIIYLIWLAWRSFGTHIYGIWTLKKRLYCVDQVIGSLEYFLKAQEFVVVRKLGH